MIFTADDVRARLRRVPFTPFRLVLTTGEGFDVRHPDLVIVLRRTLYVALPPDNPDDPELATQVPLVHVVQLRDLPAATPAA